MRHFWALPALLRPSLVLALHRAFSVHDDLLAFPQYEVKFSEGYISDTDAQAQLDADAQPGAEGGVEQYTIRTEDAEQEAEHDGGKETEQERLEYEMMVLDSQRYLCSIPQVEKPSNQPEGNSNDTQARAEEAKELARATDRGWELLSGMQGQCVFFLSGWWSYRFCYGEGVRQFHQLPPARGMPVYPPVEDPGVEGYMLGVFEPKKEQQQGKGGEAESWEGAGALEVSDGGQGRAKERLGELVTRGESRYLVQKMEGGTVCDLTGKARRIEVQFHCNPATGADRITLIKETSTCAYLMIIQTPRLCNDVAFQPPQKDAANAITCRPVLNASEVESYQRNLDAAKSALKETEIWAADPDAAVAFGMEHLLSASTTQQIVGDIVVGARSIVPPGMKLEKSAIVGGGKETYIDTIANSEGKMLGKERMKELGLGDPKEVEKLKKDLTKLAGREGWKLDVIDTPRGREYRGIIGDEENAKGSKEGKVGDKAAKGEGKGKEEPEQAGEEETGSQEEYYKEAL